MFDFVMALFRRLFAVSFAFLAACLVVPILMAVGSFLSEGGWSSFEFMPSVIVIQIMFYFTVLITLAPAMLLVAIAEAFYIRNALIYAIGGGLLGLAVYLVDALERRVVETRGLMFITGAGIVAGLVYWMIAGRNAGGWRKPPSPLALPPLPSQSAAHQPTSTLPLS